MCVRAHIHTHTFTHTFTHTHTHISTPCPIGRADQGHFFQRDEDPWVDKRQVFDAYGQVCARCLFIIYFIHSFIESVIMYFPEGKWLYKRGKRDACVSHYGV